MTHLAIFSTGARWPKATPPIKHALTLAEPLYSGEQASLLIAAAKSLRLKAERPVWEERAWAHVGIPGKKIAIFLMKRIDDTVVERHKKAWALYGWRLFGASQDALRSATVADVREVLQSLL